MKLRNGKQKKDYSKCWWYPFMKRNHIHQKHCYCHGLLTFNELLKRENEMKNLIQQMTNLSVENCNK